MQGGGTQGLPTGHAALGPVARQRSGAQRTALARSQRPKRRQGLEGVGKEGAPSLRLPLEHHRAALALVIPPGRGAAQGRGQLWHRQGPCDASRV